MRGKAGVGSTAIEANLANRLKGWLGYPNRNTHGAEVAAFGLGVYGRSISGHPAAASNLGLISFFLSRSIHDAGATMPAGSSLATMPGLSLNRASISVADTPPCRSTSICFTVPISRNSLPLSVDLPRLSSSLLACASSRRRTSRTPRVALLDADGNCGDDKDCLIP